MDPGLPLNINECDASQNVFATYGEFDFLKATYAKYDPSGYVLALFLLSNGTYIDG